MNKKIRKGDKVWLNFVNPKPDDPEYEVYEVISEDELFRLKHLKTGSIQKSLVRAERLEVV